jgi:hypothetical protein
MNIKVPELLHKPTNPQIENFEEKRRRRTSGVQKTRGSDKKRGSDKGRDCKDEKRRKGKRGARITDIRTDEKEERDSETKTMNKTTERIK